MDREETGESLFCDLKASLHRRFMLYLLADKLTGVNTRPRSAMCLQG